MKEQYKIILSTLIAILVLALFVVSFMFPVILLIIFIGLSIWVISSSVYSILFEKEKGNQLNEVEFDKGWDDIPDRLERK